MTEPARVLLVDDQRHFREATATVLRRAGYVCDCAADGAQGCAAVERARYDVILTDLKMPGNSFLEFLEEAARIQPSASIIVITAYPSLPTAVGALRLSVSDYLTKPMEPDNLLRAVAKAATTARSRRRAEAVSGQLTTLARDLAMSTPGEDGRPIEAVGLTSPIPGLSPRERDVASGIANGVRVEALATSLKISARTVRNHLQSCFRKLGVHSQVELAARLRDREAASRATTSGDP